MPIGDIIDQINGTEELKMGLYGGTVQLGILDNRRTRIIDRGIVRNLTNSTAKNLVATCVLFQQQGSSHPDLTDIPLDTIRASSFGPNKSLVEAEYRPNTSTFGGVNPVAGAQMRTTYETFTVFKSAFTEDPMNLGQVLGPFYDSDGLPNGEILQGVPKDPADHSVNVPPLPKRMRKPLLRAVVTTELSFNVLGDPNVVAAQGRVNNNTFSFGNYGGLPGPFGPRQVRFDGVDIRVFETQIGISTYRTQYVFTAVQHGTWTEHFLLTFGFGNNNAWQVINTPMYEEVPFPVFPAI